MDMGLLDGFTSAAGGETRRKLSAVLKSWDLRKSAAPAAPFSFDDLLRETGT